MTLRVICWSLALLGMLIVWIRARARARVLEHRRDVALAEFTQRQRQVHEASDNLHAAALERLQRRAMSEARS
jgi:hypothetical protein